MTLLYRIGFIVLIIIAASLGGFFYGKNQGRIDALEEAVAAFQMREEIEHETANLSPVDACIAIGGLPDECATLLRGLEETTQNE